MLEHPFGHFTPASLLDNASIFSIVNIEKLFLFCEVYTDPIPANNIVAIATTLIFLVINI